jgi:hypothetical protein
VDLKRLFVSGTYMLCWSRKGLKSMIYEAPESKIVCGSLSLDTSYVK